MSKISNMDKIYKELFGDSDNESFDHKLTNVNTKKLTKKIKMDENNNITKSQNVSKSSENTNAVIKTSKLKTDGKRSESKRKREDDLVKTSKKPRTDDNSLIKTEIKDETINEKSSKFKKSEKSEASISRMTANLSDDNLLKKEVKTSKHKKSKDEKSSKNEKTKKDSKETSKSEKSSSSEDSSKSKDEKSSKNDKTKKDSKESEKFSRSEDSKNSKTSQKSEKTSSSKTTKKVESENAKKDSKRPQKSEKSKTTSSSNSSDIKRHKKDSKDRVKSEKIKDLKQSKNAEITKDLESSKSLDTKKSSTKISEKSSKSEKPPKIKEESTKEEKVKTTSSKPETENIHIQPQAEVIVQKIPENGIKNESSKVTFQVPAKIEATPQTVPLFSLPKRIEESSHEADKELDEKLMRLYGSYQKSTSFLHISQKIQKNPQQVIQPKPVVNIQEVFKVPQPAPTRINRDRLPKRKLKEMSENSIEQKFTATKPENFKFNRENPKAFESSSVPTQPQTSVERLKEAFKIPTIPKKEPVKPNAFQRRLMNMNSIKSSIKKCNQVTWPQNETSPTQQEPKRFKDIETELLFAKIEEFYKIPEMVQPIEDHPSELHPRQVKQQEIINSWYTVENSFLMSPPTKENAKRSSLKMKIRKVSMENEGVGKQSERLIDSNLRKMIDNYAANIENIVNGIGI